MLGLHFDPSLPLVASSAFMAGVDKIEAGDAFDWRARGLTELDALAMFSAGLLTVDTTAATVASQPSSTPNQAKQQGRRDKR